MKLSFALKLGIIITVLTSTLAGMGLYFFYNYAQKGVLKQMQNRLLDISLVGANLFDENDRRVIMDLRRLILDKAPNVEEKVEELRHNVLDDPTNDTLQVLTDDAIVQLQNTKEFRTMVDRLRAIQLGSSFDPSTPVDPIHEMIEMPKANHFTFLITSVPYAPKHDVTVFIADANYADNPIGNLYAGPSELFGKPFNTGIPSVADDWYTDSFGTFFTAAVPIKADSGEVIAVLGIDYFVSEEVNDFAALKVFCISLYVVVLACSVVLSLLVAGMINRPIKTLLKGAQRIKNREYDQKIRTYSKDEFSFLADILNHMALDIKNYASGLESIVNARTQELEKANADNSKLFEQLQNENESLGKELDIARDLQLANVPDLSKLSRGHIEMANEVKVSRAVGGDYLDAVECEGKLVIGIGDVSEQGLETGLFALMMRTAIRSLLVNGCQDITTCYKMANKLAYEQLRQMNFDKYMTLSLLTIDEDGKLELTGQNEDIIIVRKNGQVEMLDTVGLGIPIGLMEDIQEHVKRLNIHLEEGDVLVLATSGVIQCLNAQGELYGIDRLCDVLKKQHHESLDHIKLAVMSDIEQFIGEEITTEDQTLVLLKKVA